MAIIEEICRKLRIEDGDGEAFALSFEENYFILKVHCQIWIF